MYSASSVDRDMLVCLTDCQYSSPPVALMQDLVVDLQSPILSAQLVLMKATNFSFLMSLKRML